MQPGLFKKYYRPISFIIKAFIYRISKGTFRSDVQAVGDDLPAVGDIPGDDASAGSQLLGERCVNIQLDQILV